MGMRDFRQLQVWAKAPELALLVYRETGALPVAEEFGLKRQMRRAAASIPTNIAEGCGRGSEREFVHFLQVAMGSASELEYQVLLAYDLHYLNPDQFRNVNESTIEVKRMLSSMITRVRRNA